MELKALSLVFHYIEGILLWDSFVVTARLLSWRLLWFNRRHLALAEQQLTNCTVIYDNLHGLFVKFTKHTHLNRRRRNERLNNAQEMIVTNEAEAETFLSALFQTQTSSEWASERKEKLFISHTVWKSEWKNQWFTERFPVAVRMSTWGRLYADRSHAEAAGSLRQ